MKQFALTICGMAVIMLGPSSLLADTIFNFSFSTSANHGSNGAIYPYYGSGQLDTQATSTQGVYLIVGAAGTLHGYPVDGVAITGVGPLGITEDNLLTVTDGVGTFVGNDSAGFLFSGGSVGFYNGIDQLVYPPTVSLLASLDFTMAYYPGGPPITLYEFSKAGFAATPTSPIVAATPEPGTFVLLATGGVGLAGAMRRRLVD